MKTHVLLINPPEGSELKKVLGVRTPPLGLLYIAAYLEKAGVPVKIIDANLHNQTPIETAYEAKRIKPNIVGLSSATMTAKTAMKIMKYIRTLMPNIVGVMGGVHSTFMPQETLTNSPELDVVVTGEGEETMLKLARALDDFSWENSENRKPGTSRMRRFVELISKVKGIVFRDPEKSNSMRTNPPRPLMQDLDALPFPARHLVPFAQYTVSDMKMPVGTMITSRGCPFACEYCSSSRIGGVGFRCRSAINIVDEITCLLEKYGLRNIEFVDDIFTLNRNRASEVAAEIRARGLDISWIASSRVDTIDKDLILRMKKSGLTSLYFGAESGSQRVLDLMKKGISIGQARDAFRITHECNVETVGSFMLGYPGETLQEMQQTISLAKELNPNIAQFSILTPFPGTPIYQRLKASGLLLTENWDRYTALEPVINYEAFGYNGRRLKYLLIEAYMRFYLRPRYLAKRRLPFSLIFKSVFKEVYHELYNNFKLDASRMSPYLARRFTNY